jgi:acetate kinase
VRVLVVNAGSSSVKLRLLGNADATLRSADLPADAGGFEAAAVAEVLRGWPTPDVVGHRIVHGGTDYSGAVRIDQAVAARLLELTDLAPLHQPKSLAALDAVGQALPEVPAVACFDTAFHATLPPEASTYALPEVWRRRYGVRRYGFHGLSHAYAARRAAQVLGRPAAALRLVTCHLGAGASLCAVVDGVSVDTTMGFTPLDGLVMATRSGSIDPGLLLWLEEHEQLSPRQVAVALEEESGLRGLAGTGDMREVQRRAGLGEPAARLALAVYLHHVAAGVAAMATAAGGLDAVVFTGGVGEASSIVRGGTAARLGWCGVAIDPGLDLAVDVDRADAEVTAAGAAVRTLVVRAREDLQVAAEVRALLAAA